MVYESILDNVGNTPMIELDKNYKDYVRMYAKLESYNPSGSVKDRAANYILEEGLNNGKIVKNTTIIESSSGNFGIALSVFCRKYGLRFICVVDPHISPVNESIIKSNGAEIIKVYQEDEYGGYLLSRIQKVKEIKSQIKNSYWVNQYSNPLNANAYYLTLGEEILRDVSDINYIFLGVSSGGTISGVSRKIKEYSPKTKVIAVDIVGSVIFGGCSKKRCIPGIGSSMHPEILKTAKIDDVVMMDEVETINSCYEILDKHYILAGGSSGSVYGAVKKYFAKNEVHKATKVVMVFADRGERYASTIYNEAWVKNFIEISEKKVHNND